ncbi:MAG: asparagine synthase (glutamine-hydrolyzing) [Chitinophagales bacterium]|nr:asparagine synthase (glutamine-hydrolyzing) [Chitinophagales bacterium]
MCGIVGYISKNQINKKLFIDTANTIIHRGPNATGFYYNDDKHIALAHQRLSILDLNESANQPFFSACKRYIIIYNGEVYNYIDIKSKYQISTTTTSDTEVILEAYIKVGASIFSELNGMFAFAIYDTVENKLVLARDRLGIKPLFYYYDGDSFAFASELKAIKKLFPNLGLNKSVIPYFLQLGFIPQPNTIYKNVYKFPTANFITINLNNIQEALNFKSFWSIDETLQQEKITDFNTAKTKLKETLFESIEQQMIADVSLGTFLSGGIDSSLVTAIASKIKKDKINTFSIGFNYNKFDESQYALQVANHLQTNHHPFQVKEKDALEQLHNIIDVYDEPYADSSCFPSLLVSQLAKQYVTVALSGDGGDELFYGYGAYTWANRLQQFPYNILHQPIYAITQLSKNNRIKRAGNLFNYKNKKHINSHIFSQEQYFFSEQELNHLLVDKNFNNDILNLNDNFKEKKQLSATEQQAIWDLQFYLKDDLLVKMDRASMQHALEVRVPLLDNRMINFAYQLPESFKISNGIQKYILKEVLYDFVPKQIFDRPKQGFAIPLIKWLKNEWHFLIDKYLNQSIIEKYNIVHFSSVNQLVKKFNKGEDYLYNRLWVLILLHWWLEKNQTNE